MNKENVGSVTDEEKDEIQRLFERKLALNELIPTLNSNVMSKDQKDELYEKAITDLGKTNAMFQKWWNDMALKYRWKAIENGNWSIDFETNEIFIVEKNCAC